MKRPKIKSKHGLEWNIQQRIIKYLQNRGWWVTIITASLYLKGMPDLYATHRVFGQKWIEVKNEKNWHFTTAQKETFPQLLGNGTQIWIMFEADKTNYDLLFKPCNCPFHLAVKG